MFYTPAQDYQGLDSFQYKWEYDQLDDWGQPTGDRLFTNVASQAIQVGNWVDLVPDNTYQNDPHHGISGVGEQETMTLTLQNPRGDGLPCTGCWSLNFDRNIVHVYTSDGNEILPNDPTGWGPIGSSIIETVPGYSSKEVTLTVVGVGGGTTGVDATWWVWGWGGGAQPGWMWKTYQNISYTVVGVDIVDLGRTKMITDLTSTIVVGQENYLAGLVTPSDLDVTDQMWTIPLDGQGNDPIAGYVQTTPNGTVDQLWPAAFPSDTIDYYWIADGQNLPVIYCVMIGGHTYTASTTFNVLRPTATLTSITTTDDPPVDVGPDPDVGSGVSLHFGLGHWPSDGITWNATVSTGDSQDGQIAFTQLVMTDTQYTLDDPAGTVLTRSSNLTYVLDGGPPQYSPPANIGSNQADFLYSSNDSPFVELSSIDKHVSKCDYFRTFLMYKSNEPGSIWTTLCTLDWFWGGSATKDADGHWSLDANSGFSSVNPTGVDTTELPQWTDYVLHLPLTGG